jgi:hypothetical protein
MKFKRVLALVLPLALCLAGGRAWADPSDFVFTPYAGVGGYAVQYAAGVQRNRDGTHEQSHSLAVATSPATHWFSAAYLGWYGEPGESLRYSELSWVNHLSLIESGALPVSIGMYAELERPRDRTQGYGLTLGPTFQFDAAHFQSNLNVWLERQVRSRDGGPATLGYQFQIKSLIRPHVELGCQAFGDLGPWAHWSPTAHQEHAVGPAVFVSLPARRGQAVRLDSALLAGLTHESPRLTFRLRAFVQL